MADVLHAGVNPQRTSFQNVSLGNSWGILWSYSYVVNLHDLIHPNVQPLVVNGRVIVPSMSGKVYIHGNISASGGGALQTTVDLGGAPVHNSADSDGTIAVTADCYGRLTAITITTGAVLWGPVQVTSYLPLYAGPLIADSKILIGGADGVFYARSLTDGSAIWSTPIGSPILQSAAWSSITGTNLVVFGCMDGKVYALNSGTGAIVWSSSVLPNAAVFMQHWPVIREAGPDVIVRPTVRYGYQQGMISPYNTPSRGIEVTDFTDDASQTAALAAYDADQTSRIPGLYILNLATGAVRPPPIHAYWAGCHSGATFPGSIDKDGYLIMGGTTPPGFTGGVNACFVRCNLATRHIVDGLFEGITTKGRGNRDENLATATCASGVALFHIAEQNAYPTGYFDQMLQTWQQFSQIAAQGSLYTINQTSSHPPSIVGGAQGLVYHVREQSTVNCWKSI